MKSQLGITPKLTMIFVLFAAALLAGVSLLAYHSGYTALQAAAVSEMQVMALEKEASLERWITERQADIAALANSPYVQNSVATLVAAPPHSAAAQAAYRQLLAELRTRTGPLQAYLDLVVLAPESGRIIAATNPAEVGKFKEDRLYFIEGQKGPYVQNVYYSIALPGMAMTAAAPLRSAEGRLLGVLAGRLNLSEMQTIINRRTGLHQSDDVFLVNTSRLFVTQPRFLSDPAVLQRGVHIEAVKRCLAGRSGDILAPDYRGLPAITVYRWLAERQLCLVVKLDQAEAFAPARAFAGGMILIYSLALLVASALAVGLARTITRPVRALQAGVARFGQGELEVRLPETSGDELGRLAGEFNAMAAALAQKERQLRHYAAQLEQIVEERTVELRQSEERFRRLAENAHDLIYRYRLSPQPGFEYVSPAATAIVGYTPAEYYADPALGFKIVHPDDRPMLEQVMADSRRLSQPVVLRWVRQDGAVIWVEQRHKPIYDETGAWVAIEGIARDITAQKQAETELHQLNEVLEQRVAERTTQLEAANKELEAFAYSVSHDLRAPLRALDGFSQALLEDYAGRLDAEGQDYLQRIRAASQRMAQLIDDMLALSHLTRREMRYESVDLSALAQAIAEELRRLEPARQVAFTIAPGVIARADASLMRVVLENLLGNAWKFTAKRAQARIEFGVGTQAGGQPLYFVRDNGAGFDMAHSDKLFGAFQRLHPLAEFPGTGIGLATVKRIIHRHGGQVYAEGAVDQGATFYFTL